MDALIKRIDEELSKAGHPSNQLIALTILGLYSFQSKPLMQAVKLFNDFVQLIITTNVSQIYILPVTPPDNFNLKLGSYNIGIFNLERFDYRCKKAGCDFNDRYRDQIKGKFSIEKDVFQTRIVDLKLYQKKLEMFQIHLLNITELFISFQEFYFKLVADKIFHQFWEILDQEQIFTVAAGAPYFNGNLFQALTHSQLITVFFNTGESRWGFVTPGMMIPTIDLVSCDKRIPESALILKEHLIGSAPSSELHASLLSFSNFVKRGRVHHIVGRIDEGFLHLIIALDLLLGERSSLSASVASRTSVLVYQKMENTFIKQEKILEKLYDKRSRYVHKGESITEKDYEIANQICQEIFFCLLRMYKAQKYNIFCVNNS